MLSDKHTLNLKISIPSQYFKAPKSFISKSSTSFFSSHSNLILSQYYIIYINNQDNNFIIKITILSYLERL